MTQQTHFATAAPTARFPSPSLLVDQQRLDRTGIVLRRYHHDPVTQPFARPPSAEHELVFTLGGTSQLFHQFDDAPGCQAHTTAGDISLIPRHTAERVAWSGEFSALHVTIPDAIVQRTAAALTGNTQPLRLEPCLLTRDATLLELLRALPQLALRDVFERTPVLDTVCDWLLAHLVRYYSNRAERPTALSRPRFDTAKTLLCQTPLSVGEIARRAGYRSAGAFRRAFKQQTGATPSQFRRLSVRPTARPDAIQP